MEAQDMTAPPDDQPGFAPDDDAPIPYMARRRREFDAQKEIARGLRERAA